MVVTFSGTATDTTVTGQIGPYTFDKIPYQEDEPVKGNWISAEFKNNKTVLKIFLDKDALVSRMVQIAEKTDSSQSQLLSPFVRDHFNFCVANMQKKLEENSLSFSQMYSKYQELVELITTQPDGSCIEAKGFFLSLVFVNKTAYILFSQMVAWGKVKGINIALNILTDEVEALYRPNLVTEIPDEYILEIANEGRGTQKIITQIKDLSNKERLSSKFEFFRREYQLEVNNVKLISSDVKNVTGPEKLFLISNENQFPGLKYPICLGPLFDCDLGNLIGGNGLPENLIMPVVKKILKIVDDLHLFGYIHADIKPRNFLVKKKLEIALCDFPSLTKIGSGKESRYGTYVSPECRNGEKGETVEKDIWALGKTIVNAIVGPYRRGKITLKEPFQTIVGNFLKDNPKERWSIKQALKTLEEYC